MAKVEKKSKKEKKTNSWYQIRLAAKRKFLSVPGHTEAMWRAGRKKGTIVVPKPAKRSR